MIPKVGCAADVYAVDALVTAVEAAKGRQKRISGVIIETAAGIAHVEEIAASSPRLQAMSLGAADFAASMEMQTTGIGGTQENYYMLKDGAHHWSDPWHWATTAIVAACRTHGILPVDGPFGDFPTTKGSAPGRGGRPRWAWSVNGRSTPSRWRWRTRSSPRPQHRSPRHATS